MANRNRSGLVWAFGLFWTVGVSYFVNAFPNIFARMAMAIALGIGVVLLFSWLAEERQFRGKWVGPGIQFCGIAVAILAWWGLGKLRTQEPPVLLVTPNQEASASLESRQYSLTVDNSGGDATLEADITLRARSSVLVFDARKEYPGYWERGRTPSTRLVSGSHDRLLLGVARGSGAHPVLSVSYYSSERGGLDSVVDTIPYPGGPDPSFEIGVTIRSAPPLAGGPFTRIYRMDTQTLTEVSPLPTDSAGSPR